MDGINMYNIECYYKISIAERKKHITYVKSHITYVFGVDYLTFEP